MAYSTIPKGNLYMDAKLYTGNSSTQNITGLDFQPDWVAIKDRDATNSFMTFDAVRGATQLLNWNTTNTESTQTPTLTSFNSDGFSIGNNTALNTNGNNLVAWNWKANGAGSSNTDGSINSTVSVNTTSGFSIVSWTATNANGATIGHGLGTTPAIVITKRLNSTGDWLVGGSAIDTARGGANSLLLLNSNSAMDSNSEVYQTFSSTTFQVGVNAGSFANGATLISYCFAQKQGYSNFSSYVGNGSTDGTFVYTGFKPAFVLQKRTDSSSTGWGIFDSTRSPSNEMKNMLLANSNAVEDTSNAARIDFLSNGFKFRTTDSWFNGSGNPNIYMAFAKNPFVATSGSTAIPVTAR